MSLDSMVECGETLMKQLEGDDASQTLAANAINGRVWNLSQTKSGCRVVQKALEKQMCIAERVVMELHGHVLEAAFSPHANFVIQKAIETMPTTKITFVATEISEKIADVARHRYGCRIIQRLLEHALHESATQSLLQDLLSQASSLCRHSFGKYVMQAISEHANDRRHEVAMALCGHPQSLLENAKHRHASRVIESVITHSDEASQLALINELLSQPDALPEIARNRSGSYVLKMLLQSSAKEQVASVLAAANGLNRSCNDASCQWVST